jgi:hypothetical protein
MKDTHFAGPETNDPDTAGSGELSRLALSKPTYRGWSRAWRTLVKPVTLLWSKDTAFHTKLTSFAGIVAVLVAVAGIIVALAVSTNAAAKPAMSTRSSTAQKPIASNTAVPCITPAIKGIRSCVLGRTDGHWLTSATVTTTKVFDVELYYQNATKEQQKNVVVRVEVPKNLKYLDGTTFLHSSDGTSSSPDGIAAGGLIIGGFLQSGDAYLKFSLVVSNPSDLHCGANIEVVNYIVVTSQGNKQAALPVTISKTC